MVQTIEYMITAALLDNLTSSFHVSTRGFGQCHVKFLLRCFASHSSSQQEISDSRYDSNHYNDDENNHTSSEAGIVVPDVTPVVDVAYCRVQLPNPHLQSE